MSTEKNKKRIRKGVKNTAKKVADITIETKDAALEKTKKIINDDIEKGIESVINTAQTIKENTQKTGEIIFEKAKKRIPKKEVEQKFFVEYENKKFNSDEVIGKFHEVWNKNHEQSEIKSLNVYYKIEDDTAYCVVNDNIRVNIKMF